MPKQLFSGLLSIIALVFVSGCASSNPSAETPGRVTTKAYVADKDRIDQDMEGGNFGYLAGTPQAPDRSQLKKTRKVYVVEITKEPGEVSDTPVEPAPSTYSSADDFDAPPQPEAEDRGRVIDLPDFDEPSDGSDDYAAPARGDSSGGASEYVVEKNDTLQKISKKFYNTYSQWPKIYEANKSVIPNPNRIKEGMVLQIPE